MVYLTQFPDVTHEDDFSLSINFKNPTTVQAEETPQEAIQRWLENQSDAELGQFVRDKTWEYWE